MKVFLIHSSSHGRHAGAGYPRQWVGLCPVEGPLCTSWFSFMNLRDILVNKETSISSAFRHQLLLELSGRASCPAPRDSEAHGKVLFSCQGKRSLIQMQPLMPAERGFLLPVGLPSRLAWVNSQGHLGSFCSLHPIYGVYIKMLTEGILFLQDVIRW